MLQPFIFNLEETPMKERTKQIFDTLYERYPALECCRESIARAYEIILNCYKNGGTVMICGNGGSSADCEHIVGELMKGFMSKRKMTAEAAEQFMAVLGDGADEYIEKLQGALPAISLVSQSGIQTAFANDVDPAMGYAQQVYGYARKGDVVIGISTSGGAKNVLHAFNTAKVLGASSVLLSGGTGGVCAKAADVAIIVPEKETYKVQEYHLPVYHCLCAVIESEMFE